MPLRSNFSKIKSFTKEFLGIPLTVISLFFIGYFVFRNTDQVLTSIASANYALIITGVLLLIFFFFFRALTYHFILVSFGNKLRIKETLFFLSLSELRRYIPGNVTAFISRLHYFKSGEITSKTIVKSLVVEALIFVLTSIPFSVLGLFFIREQFDINPFFIFSLLTAALLVIPLIYVLLKRTQQTLPEKKPIMYATVSASLGWVFFGLGNFLIASSLMEIDPRNLLTYSSLFVFSWLIGYLSFITPMGLGVREGVVTAALASSSSLSIAAAISITLRILLILSEGTFLFFAYFYKKHFYKLLNRVPWQDGAVILVSFSYILYFSYYTTAKHSNFFTGKYDLGNMTHTMWNTLQGRVFQFTDPSGTETLSRLSDHADFILILLAPLLLLWNDPRIILIFQTVIIGVGGIFVYLLAEKIIKSKNLALIFSFSYLMNFWIQWQNLFDFHSVALASTFLLAAFYFLILKKWYSFFSMLFLSVLTKENVLMVSALFGAYLFIAFKKRILGSILFLVSLVSFYLLVSIFIPNSRGEDHLALNYYSSFGSSTPEIIKNLLLNPVTVIKIFFEHNVLEYIYRLLLPTGFLSLASPLYLIFTLPDFAINVLSNNPNLRAIWYHYASIITPFVYISSIYGVARISKFKKIRISNSIIGSYLLFFALLSAWLYGPLPGSKDPHIEVYTHPLENKDRIHTFLQTIPQHLTVSATNNVAAHLTNREHIYVLPVGIESADIIVFLLNDPRGASPSLDGQIEMAETLRGDNNFRIIFEEGDFIAFKRLFR